VRRRIPQPECEQSALTSCIALRLQQAIGTRDEFFP
jgi:plasmid maintenance system antidote protein VapI